MFRKRFMSGVILDHCYSYTKSKFPTSLSTSLIFLLPIKDMEDLYRLDDPAIVCSNDVVRAHDLAAENFTTAPVTTDFLLPVDHQETDTDASVSVFSDLIKSQIATHPRFPDLVSAYIECQKVGAPPEVASLLEEIGRENHTTSGCSEMGADPELDVFMESYCEFLHRYKEELSKPFDEATVFLTDIESQLSDLCKGTLIKSLDYQSDEAGGSSEEELSGGESPGRRPSHEIKGMLMRKYSGYLSSLRKEFLKKRKNGKLPKDAKLALLDWWNNHYKWPYPTEEEKLKLSEITGLDQKQISNWFINQRKRHWKPSEHMKFGLFNGVAGSIEEGPMYYSGAGTGNDDI